MEIHDFQIGCELGEELVKTLKREKWEGDIPSYANDYSESELVMNVFPKTNCKNIEDIIDRFKKTTNLMVLWKMNALLKN